MSPTHTGALQRPPALAAASPTPCLHAAVTCEYASNRQGAVDEQVPLDRVTDFVKANAPRLQGGLRLCVVNDRHGLRSLCDDERPATVLGAMAPPIETRREVPSEAVTLYDLVRSCWDLRLRCQQPYRHEARIGASAAPAATDPPPPHGADERGVERKTTVAPLSRRAWRGLRRLWRLQRTV